MCNRFVTHCCVTDVLHVALELILQRVASNRCVTSCLGVNIAAGNRVVISCCVTYVLQAACVLLPQRATDMLHVVV